jgi:hypothetical protein
MQIRGNTYQKRRRALLRGQRGLPPPCTTACWGRWPSQELPPRRARGSSPWTATWSRRRARRPARSPAGEERRAERVGWPGARGRKPCWIRRWPASTPSRLHGRGRGAGEVRHWPASTPHTESSPWTGGVEQGRARRPARSYAGEDGRMWTRLLGVLNE